MYCDMHPDLWLVLLQVLHFFNCPPQSTEEDLLKVFKEADTVKPIRVRIFPVKPGAKSAAGLIEFDTVSGASEAIVAANHHSMPNPGTCVLLFYICINSIASHTSPCGCTRVNRSAVCVYPYSIERGKVHAILYCYTVYIALNVSKPVLTGICIRIAIVLMLPIHPLGTASSTHIKIYFLLL